ncbi:hypothetical protein D3C72_330330 [compost metagenome]
MLRIQQAGDGRRITQQLRDQAQAIKSVVVPQPEIAQQQWQQQDRCQASDQFVADQRNRIQAMFQRIEQFATLGQALQAADGHALATAELLVGFIHASVDYPGFGHVDDPLERHRRAGADKEVIVDLSRHVLEQLATQGEQRAVGGNHAAGAIFHIAQPAFVMPIQAVADA